MIPPGRNRITRTENSLHVALSFTRLTRNGVRLKGD